MSSKRTHFVFGILMQALVFAILIAGVAFLARWGNNEESAIWRFTTAGLFFGCLFLVIGWIFYVLYRCFRMWYWRVIWGGFLFIWTLLTFFCTPPDDPGHTRHHSFLPQLVVSLNRTSGVLFTRVNVLNQSPQVAWQYNYHLLQICITLYVTALMFSLLSRESFNKLLIFSKKDKNRNVFWGLAERDLLLARSISSQKDKYVQFNLSNELSYDKNTKAKLADLADDVDAFWNFVDFSKLDKKCHRGCCHFFLSDDGHANLALANQVVEAIISDKKAFMEKKLYVRAGDVDHMEIYTSWAQNVYEKTGHLVKPIIVQESEMIARKYVETFSPITAASMNGNIDYEKGTLSKIGCRTLLLGFDHTGRTLLNVRLALSRFVGVDGKSTLAMPITVVDIAQERWERYHQIAPEIYENREKYGLDFVCMKVGSEDFETWFKENHGKYDRFVFCMQGDDFNIREALRIRDVLIQENDAGKEKELIVRVANPSVNQFAQINETVLPLKFFGNLADIYSEDFMNGDPVDRIARVLNWQWNVNQSLGSDAKDSQLMIDTKTNAYKEQKDDIKRIWQDASYYERLSSRASAMGALSFFQLLGYRCVLTESVNLENCCPISEVEAKVEQCADVLARLEHLRWSTYIRSIGIRTWNLQTPLSLETIAKEKLAKCNGRSFNPNSLAKQVDRFRAHAALVDFDELPGVDLLCAQAVGIPDNAMELTEQAFTGRTHLAINERQNVPSLQCKDYDSWQAVPRAAQLAGFSFIKIEDKINAEKNNASGNQSNPILSEPSIQKTTAVLCSILAKPFVACWKFAIGIVGRLIYVILYVFYIIFWFVQKKILKRQEQVPSACKLSQEEINKLLFFAKWTKEGYQDTAQPPSSEFTPWNKFMDSNMVERLFDDLPDKTIFCFADSISPHIRHFRSERRLYKTRFPYVFLHKTGLILPFTRLSAEERTLILKQLTVRHRRIDFWSQPDFVSQVLRCGNEIYIQFRGTKTQKDWYEDGMQFFQLTPPQFRLAADLVRAVCESLQGDEIINIAGHSRGGGEVQYAVMKNATKRWKGKLQINGITFNSQRLNMFILKDLDSKNTREYAEKNIINYRIAYDAVSGLKWLGVDLIGKVCVLSTSSSNPLRILRNHSLDAFIAKFEEMKQITVNFLYQ